jgi:hypothetical protein
MKKIEFEQIKDQLVDGLDVVVRFFTFNKSHYIDVLGKITDLYPIQYDTTYKYYRFTIIYEDTLGFSSGFDEKTYPKIKTFFNDNRNTEYLHIYSNSLIFVEIACLRSYKLNKIKNSING